MRSLPFPRRLQLVKLLRAHGLRDVERLREDELKDALNRLNILFPETGSAFAPANGPIPSSTMGGARAQPAPIADDSDDPHCLPRFREPRMFLPDHERTFFRVVAVKPRQLFFTWDLHKDLPRDRPAWIQIFVRDVLGEAPDVKDVARQHPSFVVDVDVNAPGWYVDIPGDRLAVAATLVVDGIRVATSNLALTPPSRPAPPGPFWEATLQTSTSRKSLRKAGLLKGKELPTGVTLVVKGEAARVEDVVEEEFDEEVAGSGAWMRARPATGPSVSSSSIPSSIPSSSHSSSHSASHSPAVPQPPRRHS